MNLLIIVFAAIGAIVVGSTLILILAAMISEVCHRCRDDADMEIPVRCILNNEVCPYNEDENFKGRGDCEVYEGHKEKWEGKNEN